MNNKSDAELVEEKARELSAKIIEICIDSIQRDEMPQLTATSLVNLLRPYVAAMQTIQTTEKSVEEWCPSCGGNDANYQCAFPGENKRGCMRDKRLATVANKQNTGQPSKEWIEGLCAELEKSMWPNPALVTSQVHNQTVAECVSIIRNYKRPESDGG